MWKFGKLFELQLDVTIPTSDRCTGHTGPPRPYQHHPLQEISSSFFNHIIFRLILTAISAEEWPPHPRVPADGRQVGQAVRLCQPFILSAPEIALFQSCPGPVLCCSSRLGYPVNQPLKCNTIVNTMHSLVFAVEVNLLNYFQKVWEINFS